MKTLYFDIDGTILLGSSYAVKPCLANGRLEAGIRKAKFERLVCVGNLAGIIRMVQESGIELDEWQSIIEFCCGAFVDAAWFKSVTVLMENTSQRTRHIDYSGDWWYVDDLAEEYFIESNQKDVFDAHRRGRVLVTNADSDGQDVLDWLENTVAP